MPFRRREKKPKTRRVRKLRLLGLLTILGLVCGVAFVYGLVTAIASEIPKLSPIHQSALEQDGFIYASDGKTVLTRLRGDESRVLVESKDINPWMKHAIVAVEDRRFWEHRGVDLRGIGRAIWADVQSKDLVQGGSTITQQFVKNSLGQDDRTVSRKLKEAALAWQLERRWSKDRILTAYLNTVFFGNSAYGVQMAARVYFNKKAHELTLPEAALLAGIPANPSLYNPVTNPKTTRARRSTVLHLMYEQKMITAGEMSAADHAPLPKAEDIHLPGSGGPASYFVEYVKQQLIDTYGPAEVFGGGLKVTTTIDLGLQNLARRTVNEVLGERGKPSAALVAIDPRDGRVLAMYGGRSFRESQFNLAVQGERQPGSSFKPFVLAAALHEGISPQTTFVSEPQLINMGDKLWSVHNYEGSYLGRIDLFDATTHSDNAVYAQLTALVGPKKVAQMAHRLGITSPLDEYFAIGLGVEAVNPLEMARAFSTFANGGERVDGSILGNRPRAVVSIERDGKKEKNAPVGNEVIGPNENAILTAMLEDVVDDGTGQRAALDDRPVAGKTGTTENYGDAWFVGYTPQLAVAVWVGYPNKLVSMDEPVRGRPGCGRHVPRGHLARVRQARAAPHGRGPRVLPRAELPLGQPSSGRLPRQPVARRQRQLQVGARGALRQRLRAGQARGVQAERGRRPTGRRAHGRRRPGAAVRHAADARAHHPAGQAGRAGRRDRRAVPEERDALVLGQGAHRDHAGSARPHPRPRRADARAGSDEIAEARARARDRRRRQPRRRRARRPRAASEGGPRGRQGHDGPADRRARARSCGSGTSSRRARSARAAPPPA